MEVNGYTPQHKLLKARAYMTGTGKHWYAVTMNMHPDMSWQQFKKRFLKDFVGADNLESIARRLESAVQQQQEHPTSYAFRVLDLCVKLDAQMPDKRCVYWILRGLDHVTRNLIAVSKPHGDWTVDALLEVFSILRAQPGSIQERDVSPSTRFRARARRESPTNPVKPRDLASWTCFNCDRKGHVVEDCTLPRDEDRIQRKKSEHRATKLHKLAEARVTTEAAQIHEVLGCRLPGDNNPKPYLVVKINGVSVSGRIDSGADMTVLPGDVARDLKLQLLPWNQPNLVAANSTEIPPIGLAPVMVAHDSSRKPLAVAVVAEKYLAEPLWGNDLLCVFAMKLEFSCQEGRPSVAVVDAESSCQYDSEGPVDKVEFGLLSIGDRNLFEDMLDKYPDTFSRTETDTGRTSTTKRLDADCMSRLVKETSPEAGNRGFNFEKGANSGRAPRSADRPPSELYALARARYFWPRKRKDIKRHVSSRPKCQRRKALNTKKGGLTQPLSIAEDVFDSIGIDLASKLPKSERGFDSILVVAESSSKFLVTVALGGEKSNAVIHLLFNNFIAKFGVPKAVLCDRGTNLNSQVVNDVCRPFGIGTKRTSAYRPQTNGQTKGFSPTLAASLTMYVESNQRNWPGYLQALTFAYNILETSRGSPALSACGKKDKSNNSKFRNLNFEFLFLFFLYFVVNSVFITESYNYMNNALGASVF